MQIGFPGRRCRRRQQAQVEHCADARGLFLGDDGLLAHDNFKPKIVLRRRDRTSLPLPRKSLGDASRCFRSLFCKKVIEFRHVLPGDHEEVCLFGHGGLIPVFRPALIYARRLERGHQMQARGSCLPS